MASLTNSDKSLDKASDIEENSWNICENWCGSTERRKKNFVMNGEKKISKPKQKKRKTTYLDNCPEWDYY